MSCQRGNVAKTGRQKYLNKTKFRNDMHDLRKITKQINHMEITDVCQRCQDVIAWKVKYKKYKPLTQPKTCIKCCQKTIKSAYHILCDDCGRALDVCCKCGKKEKIVALKTPTEQEKSHALAEIEVEVRKLPERKRRSYYRFMQKLDDQTKPVKKKIPKEGTIEVEREETEEDEEGNQEDIDETKEAIEDCDTTKESNTFCFFTLEEIVKRARDKLDELQKGLNDEFDDDLSLNDDSESD